jgi:hypothetical protein
MRTAILFVLCASCLVFSSTAASAQETRAEQAERLRAEKAKQLQPYARNKAEAAVFRVEDRYLVERIFNPPRGLFARFGGLPEGAGLAAGPAYRYSTHAWSATTTSALSIRGSWEVEGRLAIPRPTLTPAPLFVSVGGHYRDLPQEDFWGLGVNSSRFLRTSYALQQTSIDATGGVSPVSWFTVGAGAEYRTERPGRGEDKSLPSTDVIFSEATAPGLQSDIDYIRFGTIATIDYTSIEDGPRVGGRYSASYDKYLDRNLELYSFQRWDLELQQFLPIFTRSRMVALRAHLAGTNPDDGNEVPFYLQPWLGGSHSLRGYRVTRFRDRYSMLLQSEYRWQVNDFLTGVLFFDTGKVGASRHDLDFDNLQHDWGFGLRLGFLNIAAIRAEVVFGAEEGHVVTVRFGDVF